MKQQVSVPFRCATGSALPLMAVGRRHVWLSSLLLVVLLQTVFLFCHAQTTHSRRKEDFDVHEFTTATIHIANKLPGWQLSTIRDITVMDARADTSTIGFMQKKIVSPVLGSLNGASRNQLEQRVNKTPTFIVLAGGLQQEAAAYLAHAVACAHNDSLPGVLVVIKKLWLSDELTLDRPERNADSRFEGPSNKDVWTSGINVKIEFYLHTGKAYYPLCRYDTTLSETMTVSEYGPEFVELALQLAMRKMALANAALAINRPSFSLADVRRRNQNDFNLAVLTDTIMRPGVYMTFEEFKNNQPSQKSFELIKDKLTDILYIKQADGKEYVARDVWGYCNGKNAFVKSGDNFFLLQRRQQAFYIFGSRNSKWVEGEGYRDAPTGAGNSGAYAIVYYKNPKWQLQLKPFQLDWSTGNLY